MKLSLTIASVVLACATVAFGQASQTQPQSSQPPAAQQGGMPHHHHAHGRMQHNRAEMRQHMLDMQTLIAQLQTRAGKLRSDAQSVQDMATRTALLDDVDMWNQIIGHMQDMLQHMQGMMDHEGMEGGGMNHMGMMDGDHGCCQHCKRHHPSGQAPNSSTNPQ